MTIQAFHFINNPSRFLFDYGGTLIPHGKPPGSEDLSRILDILTKLTADPRNAVYVISGRTKINIETDLGCIPGLGLRLVSFFFSFFYVQKKKKKKKN